MGLLDERYGFLENHTHRDSLRKSLLQTNLFDPGIRQKPLFHGFQIELKKTPPAYRNSGQARDLRRVQRSALVEISHFHHFDPKEVRMHRLTDTDRRQDERRDREK